MPRADAQPAVRGRDVLDRFWAMMDQWTASISAMTDEQLDRIGFGQHPGGFDPHIPVIAIIWRANGVFAPQGGGGLQ